jgi:hypothetical protein
MGISAILDDKYTLFVTFAYHPYSRLNEKFRTTEYNIYNDNFTSQRFGMTNQGISAQHKILLVSSYFK